MIFFIALGLGMGAAAVALCFEIAGVSIGQVVGILPELTGSNLISQSLGALILLACIEETALYLAVSLTRPVRSFVTVFAIAIGFTFIEVSLPLLAHVPASEVFFHFAPIILLHISTLALYASWRLGARWMALIPGILLHILFNTAIAEDSPLLLPLALVLSAAILVFSYLAHLGQVRYTEDEIR